MPDKPRFFAEAARVLRPGIRLVICAWLTAEHPAPRQARFLFDRHAHNRIIALTAILLWLAIRTGAMRYGVFTLQKQP